VVGRNINNTGLIRST